MRILAVDDDTDFLDLLQTEFRGAGIDLTTCTSGPRALTLLEQQPFDAVMVDLVMPVMDGRALARHIRGRPRHAGLPIVMMTHMANVSFIAAAGNGDSNHFVNKGGEPACLIDLVSRLAGRRVSSPGP
jgi:two-component system, chemotaxis family, chemotaxis protein CheY